METKPKWVIEPCSNGYSLVYDKNATGVAVEYDTSDIAVNMNIQKNARVFPNLHTGKYFYMPYRPGV